MTSNYPCRKSAQHEAPKSQTPGSSNLGANNNDRLSRIQEQIKNLNFEEQRFLLSALSERLKAVSDQSPGDTASLTTHLSIHTPHRTLKQFRVDEEAENNLSGPLVSSSLQLHTTNSAAGITVRTPRAKYNVVFAGDENGELPSAMTAIEAKEDSVSRAILTPMEWSLRLSRKPDAASSIGALRQPFSSHPGLRGKHVVQPPSYRSAECTTRLEAYRPDGIAQPVGN